MSVILTAWETEVETIAVAGWSRQGVCEISTQSIAGCGGIPVIPGYMEV
jgi:hypothetical protein